MTGRHTYFIGLVLFASIASPQGNSQTARLKHAPNKPEQAKVHKIDTGSFFVQIDKIFSPQPRRPKNPVQFPDYPGSINDLPVGHVQAFDRTMNNLLFPGITATGWTPADPDIAVGPNHVVAVVNSSIAFFSKSGTQQFQQTSVNFFSGMGANSFQFDPKCLYDRVHNRFVVLFDELDDVNGFSYLLLAVSDDSDPNGNWYRYRINVTLADASQNYWLDYPGFGYNKDGYVVSGNMFGFFNGFGGAQFIVIPSAPVLSGAGFTPTHFLDSGGASVQMAEVIDPTNNNVFGVSRVGISSVEVYSIFDIATVPAGTFTTVTVPTNAAPNSDAESTNGKLLDTMDGRVYNAVWRQGRLVTAHNLTGSSQIGARWYEFNTGSWPTSGAVTLVQSGNVEHATLNYFAPAINRNSVGDISMIFTGSSPTTTANIMVAGRLNGDPLGAMGTPVILESAGGNNYSQNRWGDYFGCDVDPVNDTTFWGVAMTIRADNNWTTSIYSWNIVPSVTSQLSSLTVNPSSVLGGGSSTGTILLTTPAGASGTIVALSSNNSAAVVPSTVVVPAGASTISFAITTTTVRKNTNVTITAVSGGVTKTTVLAVTKPRGRG